MAIIVGVAGDVYYATQKRTPKLSADFYKEVIAGNAVV